MFRILFLLFVIIPIIEIFLLMNVGAWIGAWPTIAIVIFTAWLGAKNVRKQGIATFNSVQTKIAQGQAPSDEIIAGVMLLIAGVLLVTPGFVTDIFGLSLLIPQVRQALIKTVKKNIVLKPNANTSGASHFTYQSTEHYTVDDEAAFHQSISPPSQSTPHKGETLEGDFERKD
jgi:UPF0716 protein FxsA